MSDIREAFEAWFDKEFDPEITLTMEDKEMCFEAWQAALQSQTAPAVPEGWMLFPVEAWDFLAGVGPLSGCHFGDTVNDDKTGRVKPFWWRSHIRHMLAAAPQPDHSPDAGKVVQGNPRALWDFANEVAQGKWNQYNRSPDAGINAVLNDAFRHGTGFAVFDESGVNHVERNKVIATPAADGGKVVQEGPIDIEMGTGDVLIGDLKGDGFSGVIFYRDSQEFEVGQPHPEMSGIPCNEVNGRIFSVTTSNPESLKVLYRAVGRALDHLGHPPTPAADGGEVEPVGWIWETYGQRNFTAGTHHKNVLEADGLTLIPVYPHPAQPRNEVQAEALTDVDEVGRRGDMGPSTVLRVGFDSDRDIYVSAVDENGIGGVEFCTIGSGGGRSPKTRKALVALMVAMQEDNKADPSRDFWAERASQQEGGEE